MLSPLPEAKVPRSDFSPSILQRRTRREPPVQARQEASAKSPVRLPPRIPVERPGVHHDAVERLPRGHPGTELIQRLQSSLGKDLFGSSPTAQLAPLLSGIGQFSDTTVVTTQSTAEVIAKARQALESACQASQPQPSSAPPSFTPHKKPPVLQAQSKSGRPSGRAAVRIALGDTRRENTSLDDELQRLRRRWSRITALEQQLDKVTAAAMSNAHSTNAAVASHRGHRTPEAILESWRAALHADPTGSELREEERHRARADRHYHRTHSFTPKKLEAITSAQIAEVKEWRVPRGVRATMYATPHVSCHVVKVLPELAVVVELEARSMGDAVWVRTEGGWIQAHASCGTLQRVQLQPRTRAMEATAGEVMLHCLDDITGRIDATLDAHAAVSQPGSKDLPEHSDPAAQAAAREVIEEERRQVRCLPDGRSDMLHQTWKAMQEVSRTLRPPPEFKGALRPQSSN